MREREALEHEIYRAREDLEASVAELKQVVTEKVDVPARARVAVAKGKLAAQDALADVKVVAQGALADAKAAAIRGKDRVKQAAVHGKDAVKGAAVRGKDGVVDAYDAARNRPDIVIAVASGIVAVGALIYIGRRRDWW